MSQPSAVPADGLTIGKPPPPLRVAAWVRGQPVDLTEQRGRNVCVVEFWTTWCPPCLLAVPERASLQARLGGQGLILIAVTNEPPAQVRAVLSDYPHEITYRVACDDQGRTFRAYLRSRGVRNLPYAVVIDRRGRVAWMGDPRGVLEDIVVRVLDGRWNIERARAGTGSRERLRGLSESVIRAIRSGQCKRILALAQELAELDVIPEDLPQRAAIINEAARHLLAHDRCAGRHTNEALRLAKIALDACEGRNPSVFDTYARALFEMGDIDGAISSLQKAVALAKGTSNAGPFRSTLSRYERARDGKTGESFRATARPTTKPASQPRRAEVRQALGRWIGGQLTQDRAVEDLRHLHELLELHYAGYDDLAWKLLCTGSSWSQRTRQYAQRLRARETWTPKALFGLFREYLAAVQDSHFGMRGPDRAWGVLQSPRKALVVHHIPFFTNLRLRRESKRFLVVAAGPGYECLVGLELSDVPVVSLERAALQMPFLFPTVPAKGPDEEYLLGAFLEAARQSELELTFRKADGGNVPARLKLHRGGAKLTPWLGKPWTVRRPPAVRWPTLSVRTMNPRRLGGLSKSAQALRKEPVVVLDLRGNRGGADGPARQWCPEFSQQEFRWWGGGTLARGVRDGQARWSCGLASIMDGTSGPTKLKGESFHGRLFVLIDRGVASSGETFTALAAQIPGAVLLGENTRGCTSYGNCAINEALPNSGIRVRFGYSKFVLSTVRPTREGVGFLPDYWLDGLDPYAAVERLLED